MIQNNSVPRSKSMLEYAKTNNKLGNYDDATYNSYAKKFIDSSNKVVYSFKLNDELKDKIPKEIKPKKKGITSSYVIYKEKDLVEWNKYARVQIPKRLELEKELDEKFEFTDIEKYKIYLGLCETRDNFEKIPKSKIERNKKLDPVFTKRYRQFIFAKSCNKAPEFDHRDNSIKPCFNKNMIKIQREKIIDDKPIKKEKSYFYQNEFLKNVERAKKFSQQLHSI